MGSFYTKQKMYERKIYRRVICLDIEERSKIKQELTYRFKIDMGNLTNFNPSTRKPQKFELLTGSFWPKYIMLELEKYSGVMLALKIDAKFEGKLDCENGKLLMARK